MAAREMQVAILAAPVGIWMLRRDSGWRRAVALCAAMLLPVAPTLAVGALLGRDFLLWLVNGLYPLMTVGPIACLVLAPALFERGRDVAAG